MPHSRRRSLAAGVGALSVGGGASPVPSSGGAKPGRTAICLVGQLRSIDDTGPSLKRHLLEHWNADAFVVALTEHNRDAQDDDCSRMQSLGSRVQRILIGSATELLDQELASQVQNAPFMNQSFLVQQEPQTDWTRRFSEQFLTRKLCRDMVLEYEQELGHKYDVYGRVRLDTMLLEPFPRYFLDHVTDRRSYHGLGMAAGGARQMHVERSRAFEAEDASLLAGAAAADFHRRYRFGQLGSTEWTELANKDSSAEWATANHFGVGKGHLGAPTVVEPKDVFGISAVPMGEDYGLERPLGLMDKMMVGDSHAFEADASVWRTITETPFEHSGLWLMEGLNRDHNFAWGVEVRRLPLSYLILKSDQSAKYPSELHYALKRHPDLLAASPELCGDLGRRACNPCKLCGIMPESARQEDPAFCALIARCNATYSDAKHDVHDLAVKPRCADDGTVHFHGQWLNGTARCLFDSRESRLATIDLASVVPPRDNTSCPAATLLENIASGGVTKSHVEMVISSYNAKLAWTKPWEHLRTVYRKAALGEPSDERCELRQRGIVQLPNHGRESHSYLYHIVKNWDNLAERTVFMQDREPSCGFFMSSGELGDHLMMNVSLFDYLDPANGDTFMPLTMKFDTTLSTCSLRSTFADLGDSDLQTVSRPVAQAPEANPAGQAHDFWLPWEHNDFQAWIYKISEKTVNNTARQLPPGVPQLSFAEFFQNVFDRPPPTVVFFSQGGQFAASREAIKRTPRHKYRYVMEMIEAGHEEFVYYCEAAWFYFMHGADHPMIALDESPPPERSAQAHFLSHLPKKTILAKFAGFNYSHPFNATEANVSSRAWMNSLSGSVDLSSPWSAAYFQRLAHSFVQHESHAENNTIAEPTLARRIADGRWFEHILHDTIVHRHDLTAGQMLAHSVRHLALVPEFELQRNLELAASPVDPYVHYDWHDQKGRDRAKGRAMQPPTDPARV